MLSDEDSCVAAVLNERFCLTHSQSEPLRLAYWNIEQQLNELIKIPIALQSLFVDVITNIQRALNLFMFLMKVKLNLCLFAT